MTSFCYAKAMTEITFNVERCQDTGMLVASWDEPDQNGGITTQGIDLTELQEMVKEAVLCHFNEGEAPSAVGLHLTVPA